MNTETIAVVVMFGFLLVIALIIVRMRDLFAAAMLFGIFSLLSAGLFVIMDAVDVAFTEAAVGAGLSTVLLIVALSLMSTEETVDEPRSLLAFLITVLTGAALVYGTLDLPRIGDPQAPVHTHVAPHYIEESPHEIGIPNMVTSVLASYRGFDTLGETTVVLTAGLGVLLLLQTRRREEEEEEEGAGVEA